MNLLDISDAGVMLAAAGAPLQLVAASSERMRAVELFELDARAGPCLTAYREGRSIDHTPLDASPVRWPEFSAHAYRAGYRCVHATPIRLRTDTIGVLNLFRRTPEVLGEADRHLSRALADATTISLVQQASLDHQRTVNRQLQRALDSRSAIEQAKGFLASTRGTDPGTAFEQLRAHARRHRIRLADLSRDVVAGAVTLPPRQHRRTARKIRTEEAGPAEQRTVIAIDARGPRCMVREALRHATRRTRPCRPQHPNRPAPTPSTGYPSTGHRARLVRRRQEKTARLLRPVRAVKAPDGPGPWSGCDNCCESSCVTCCASSCDNCCTSRPPAPRISAGQGAFFVWSAGLTSPCAPLATAPPAEKRGRAGPWRAAAQGDRAREGSSGASAGPPRAWGRGGGGAATGRLDGRKTASRTGDAGRFRPTLFASTGSQL
ncbi:ANTAR domain-containing protein [Streptomyces minutiscleroticus]|nr:GAF and ANTAR domain-containing protein [Streptomyces minutiscleroticus]